MITPTIASFLILFGLQTQTSIFSLSSFPFRYIGRISYSLYLVHWPIIILLKINYGSTLIIQGLAIVLSFFFAYVLHEKIEKKCRLHKIKAERAQSFWPKRKSLVNLGLFSSSIFVILIGIYTSTMTTPIKIDDIQQSTAVNSSFKANIKSDNKNIWTCQTYEKGVLNGESKYKLSMVSPWWEAWLGPWWGLGGTKREEREKEREDGVLVRGGFSCRNSNSGTKIGALHKDWCTAQG